MVKFEVKQNVAVVGSGLHITDGQGALELIQAARYHTGCSAVLARRNAFDEALYDLSSGMALDVLKQFTANHMRLAIVGDFYDCYQTPMREFIFTCNRGCQIGFWETEEEGLAWLNKKR